jgi:hypothetical protein
MPVGRESPHERVEEGGCRYRVAPSRQDGNAPLQEEPGERGQLLVEEPRGDQGGKCQDLGG